MPIPIAKINVAPIEMPIDELVKMISPFMVCEKCKLFEDGRRVCITQDFMGDPPKETFGCNLWKSNGR